jgi:transcriptional regulator of acetoin/glycerol metabolism
MQVLIHYDWPGNIRELANVLERAQILAEDHLITVEDLPETMQTGAPPATVLSSDPFNLAALEARTVQAALQPTPPDQA